MKKMRLRYVVAIGLSLGSTAAGAAPGLIDSKSAQHRSAAIHAVWVNAGLAGDPWYGTHDPLAQLVMALRSHPRARKFCLYYECEAGSLSIGNMAVYDRRAETMRYFCQGAEGDFQRQKFHAHYLFTDVTPTILLRASKMPYIGPVRVGWLSTGKNWPKFREEAGGGGCPLDVLLTYGCRLKPLP